MLVGLNNKYKNNPRIMGKKITKILEILAKQKILKNYINLNSNTTLLTKS